MQYHQPDNSIQDVWYISFEMHSRCNCMLLMMHVNLRWINTIVTFACLIIYFDRHTLQWWVSQNLGNGFCQICFLQRWKLLPSLPKKQQQGGFSLNWLQYSYTKLNWLQYSIHKCDRWLKIVYYSWFPLFPFKPFETKLGKQLDILKNNWTGWKQFGNLLLTLFMSSFLWDWVLYNCLQIPWSRIAIKIQQMKLACWEV